MRFANFAKAKFTKLFESLGGTQLRRQHCVGETSKRATWEHLKTRHEVQKGIRVKVPGRKSCASFEMPACRMARASTVETTVFDPDTPFLPEIRRELWSKWQVLCFDEVMI